MLLAKFEGEEQFLISVVHIVITLNKVELNVDNKGGMSWILIIRNKIEINVTPGECQVHALVPHSTTWYSKIYPLL